MPALTVLALFARRAKDLDITPALHHDNLGRLRPVLEAIHARQYENASFGHWEATAAGEHRWVREEAALPCPRQVEVAETLGAPLAARGQADDEVGRDDAASMQGHAPGTARLAVTFI